MEPKQQKIMENEIEDSKIYTFYGSFVARMIHSVTLAFKSR